MDISKEAVERVADDLMENAAIDSAEGCNPDVVALEENAAYMIRALSARIAELEAQVARWRKNSKDTWGAMNAMRNSINEHIPMPSIEGDLLQGPENSIFCATVADAVVIRIAELEAQQAAVVNGGFDVCTFDLRGAGYMCTIHNPDVSMIGMYDEGDRVLISSEGFDFRGLNILSTDGLAANINDARADERAKVLGEVDVIIKETDLLPVSFEDIEDTLDVYRARVACKLRELHTPESRAIAEKCE